MNKKVLTVVLSAVFFFHPFFAQNAAVSAFLDGCKAYTSGDWTSAVFSLKKFLETLFFSIVTLMSGRGN